MFLEICLRFLKFKQWIPITLSVFINMQFTMVIKNKLSHVPVQMILFLFAIHISHKYKTGYFIFEKTLKIFKMKDVIYKKPNSVLRLARDFSDILRKKTAKRYLQRTVFTPGYLALMRFIDLSILPCTTKKVEMTTLFDLILDMLDKRSFFAKTVEHLARCLAALKPTPWEKVCMPKILNG